ESGSDYEDPQEDGEDSYIFATDESQTTEQQHSEESSEEECEQPPLPSRPRLPPKVPELQDSRDPVHFPPPVPIPAERPSKPPPRMSFTLPKPFKASASKPSLHVDRTTKPGKPSPPQRDVKKSKGSTVIAPGSSTSKPPQPRPPKATDVSR
ncbi:hypothetical protein E3U43_001102, partial [Larimichthys crocea]